MRIIDSAELKVIQMDILEVVDKFCINNHIRYSLACGSLLGAIRHKGYIPWDDDIDIYIPREDYERFVRIFPNKLCHIKLASLEREPRWNRPYAQAYDTRTIMNECAKTPIKVGVYIDIYPIDMVPDFDAAWLQYNRLRRILIHAYELKYIPIRRERSVIKNMILIWGKLLLFPFSSRYMAVLIGKFAKKYNGKGYSRCFECVQGMLQKKPFKRSLLNELIRTDFEDRQFMIMKEYDAYLSNGYGNYMQLPPKEAQITHHKFEAYWKD